MGELFLFPCNSGRECLSAAAENFGGTISALLWVIFVKDDDKVNF
jgi:hypothetical protein